MAALLTQVTCLSALAQPPLTEADAVAIQAAVVRAEIARHFVASDHEIPLRYCLDTTRRTDPSPSLLAALTMERAPVVARSLCGDPCKVPEDFEGSRFPCIFVTVGDAVPIERISPLPAVPSSPVHSLRGAACIVFASVALPGRRSSTSFNGSADLEPSQS